MKECAISGCTTLTDSMFCDSHRCTGTTKAGTRCASSYNCGIHSQEAAIKTAVTEEEREILRNTTPEPWVEVENLDGSTKELQLTCFKCKMIFTFVGEDQIKAGAAAWVKARGICKQCRS